MKKKKEKKPSEPPRLSEAEWIVMRPFWEQGELAARDLFAALSPQHNWSYETVKTMLGRLVRKGALDYTRVGNSYLYRPRFTQEQMRGVAVKQFSDRVLNGSLEPFLVHFFEGKEPSTEEIRALREMISQLEHSRTSAGQKKGGKP